MKKKLLALLCAISLVIGLNAAAVNVEYGAELNPNEKVYTQTFADVPENHWAFKMIEDLVERGAINGYPDGNFYPNNIVTRQEFAKIMVVAAKEPVYPASSVSFSDVPLSHWANPFIEAAKPYMTAYQDRQGNQTFKPEAGALREDMAVAVVKLRGYDTRLADLSILTTMFSDVDSISASARPYVALAVENGIISGYPGQNGQKGTFGAQRTITRCEAAAILWRAFQYGSDEKVIPGDQPDQPAPSNPVNTPEPTKPAQPSPSPSLPPEPAEPQKPYVAETLARANVSTMYNGTRFLHITMDDNDHVIYYDIGKEQIISLDPSTKKTSALLNAKTARCNKGGVTYTDLAVDQVFWDNVAGRLLVLGKLQTISTQVDDDGWEISGGNAPETCSGIFTLRDGALDYTYQLPPQQHYERGVVYLICALQNGNFVCGEIEDDCLNHEYFDNVYISDLESNSQLNQVGYTSYDGMIAQSGNGLYQTSKGGYDSSVSLRKYNYGSDSWEKLGEMGCGSSSSYNSAWGYMVAYRNGLFYVWDVDGVRAVRPSDAAQQQRLDPTEDVEVLDMTPVPAAYTFNAWYDRLFVTSDEQFIFYDTNANAFRVIRKNPDASI